MTLPIPSFSTSPSTCGVMGLLKSGEAFLTTIIHDVSALQSNLATAVALLTSLPSRIEGILLSDVQATINNLEAIASGAVNTLLSHVTAQLTNLVNNLTMAIGQASANSGLTSSGCTLPSVGSAAPNNNPCGNMQNLFGSIMGLGGALVNSALSSLGSITGAANGLISGALTDISGALNTITGLSSQLTAVAAQMTSMVTSEVAALAGMLSDMISFGAANALFSIIGHPCGNLVLSSVGSPQLLGYLSG